jgi:MoaD family protein
MKIKVKFYGTVRDIVKEKEVEIEGNGILNIMDIINIFIERYGNRFKERILTNNGKLQSYVRIFINDDPVDYRELDKKLINKGDSEILIYILPAQMGGLL